MKNTFSFQKNILFLLSGFMLISPSSQHYCVSIYLFTCKTISTCGFGYLLSKSYLLVYCGFCAACCWIVRVYFLLWVFLIWMHTLYNNIKKIAFISTALSVQKFLLVCGFKSHPHKCKTPRMPWPHHTRPH